MPQRLLCYDPKDGHEGKHIDATAAAAATSSSAAADECPYGAKCYRTNAEHAERYHSSGPIVESLGPTLGRAANGAADVDKPN